MLIASTVPLSMFENMCFWNLEHGAFLDEQRLLEQSLVVSGTCASFEAWVMSKWIVIGYRFHVPQICLEQVTLLGAWYGDHHLLLDVEAVRMSTLTAQVLELNTWTKMSLLLKGWRLRKLVCSWETFLVSQVSPADSEQHEGAWCHWYMRILSIKIGWISLSQKLCSPCLMQVQHADARSLHGRCFLLLFYCVLIINWMTGWPMRYHLITMTTFIIKKIRVPQHSGREFGAMQKNGSCLTKHRVVHLASHSSCFCNRKTAAPASKQRKETWWCLLEKNCHDVLIRCLGEPSIESRQKKMGAHHMVPGWGVVARGERKRFGAPSWCIYSSTVYPVSQKCLEEENLAKAAAHTIPP